MSTGIREKAMTLQIMLMQSKAIKVTKPTFKELVLK